MTVLVDYLVARSGLPARSGLAYDYIVARDGVFVAASSPLLEVRVPVARSTVRGLQPVFTACTLVHGRVPLMWWEALLRILRLAHTGGCEMLVGIAHDTGGYYLVVPRQTVGPAAVEYEPAESWLLEVHSHRDGPARFSTTDTRDEQGLRMYGVVGRLDRPRPQVALRACAYGYFLPIRWSSVFDDDPDSVEDVHADGQCRSDACGACGPGAGG